MTEMRSPVHQDAPGRRRQILRLIGREGRVTVEGLASRYQVTHQTIRRDLSALAQAGQVVRDHGGAVLAEGASAIRHAARQRDRAGAKDRMGQHVAGLIGDGAVAFLDIGTSVEAVARRLVAHRDLLVVTNNLNVAAILMPAEGVEVVVAGGTVRKADGALVGAATVDLVRQYKADWAVIGASAIDGEGDLLDHDLREGQVTRAMLGQARRRLLVADGSKFGRTAPVRVAGLAELDLFVTDAPPPGPVAALCARAGTGVTVVG